MDVLSEVLLAVRLTGAVFFDNEARAPWVAATPSVESIARLVMPDAELVIPFHVVISGSCWAELIDGSEKAIPLNAGDIVIFATGGEHVLASAPGLRETANSADFRRPLDRRLPLPYPLNHDAGGPESCRFVCGFLGCDARPFNPLLEVLPRVFHAPTSPTSRGLLNHLIEVAVKESEDGSAGGATMLARLAELMFVEVVRRHLSQLPADARGWLSGLRDRQIGAALRLIHCRPTEDWTIEKLAREVGLSRTLFAERFHHFVGISPMHYLGRWRMQLAARLLERSNVSLAQAAEQVGYESEAAFQRAFKKFLGVPPGAWRKGKSASHAIWPTNGSAAG